MSIRNVLSQLTSPGQAGISKHELEYIPFLIASRTFVKATVDRVSVMQKYNLGESSFQHQYSAANNALEVYLSMDLSSAPQHSAPRAGSLALEQAFDCPESFGATTLQEQCGHEHTGAVSQDDRCSGTRCFAQQGAPMMKHTTNKFYGSADLVAEMSSPPQLIYTLAYSPLQPTRLPGKYGQVASTTAQFSFITWNYTTAPFISQGIMKSERAAAPSQVGGAYSTPYFRFSPPGWRSAGNVENSRTQQTPTPQVDNKDKQHAPSFTSTTPPSSSAASPTMSAAVVNDARSQRFDFSEAIKSVGQHIRASASAAVAVSNLSNVSHTSVRVPSHGSTRPPSSPARSTLNLDSALMYLSTLHFGLFRV
ncbi:hypothetical protein MVEG_01454 [Podila verticillata NRRL 6337]|nr:hypothetical protein MVEG_01454 [Podila verticillata NRRL 6337]